MKSYGEAEMWSRCLWKIKSPVYDWLRLRLLQKRDYAAVTMLLNKVPFNSVRQVLDAGSGTGGSLSLLTAYTPNAIGLDSSMAMLRKTTAAGILVNGDIMASPFNTGIFDLILCVGVSEYIADLENLLITLNLHLCGGGYLIFTQSPVNGLNFLRKLSGHRLYLRNEQQTEKYFKETNFKIIKKSRTIIQAQYLLQKILIK